jgi:hypothetical protein
MAAVNGEYRGGSDRLDIVHMEFSQADSLVMIDADGGRGWRCIADDGYVQELRRDGSGSHSGGGYNRATAGADRVSRSTPTTTSAAAAR